ncbi:hypothetical protein AR445_01905 [Klebsiella quasipneumoniae]|nr:hypothetical protein AR445_01905 [Klebsiella quasipneumoniae]
MRDVILPFLHLSQNIILPQYLILILQKSVLLAHQYHMLYIASTALDIKKAAGLKNANFLTFSLMVQPEILDYRKLLVSCMKKNISKLI